MEDLKKFFVVKDILEKMRQGNSFRVASAIAYLHKNGN